MLYNGEMLIKTLDEQGNLETVELSEREKEAIKEQEEEI